MAKYILVWIIAIALNRLLPVNSIQDDIDFIAPGNAVPPYTSYLGRPEKQAKIALSKSKVSLL